MTQHSLNAVFVRKIIEQVKHVGVNPSLFLLGREFYSTDVIRALDSMGVRYLIPGINTGPVKKALAHHANPPAFKQCVVCGEEFRYCGGPRKTCDKAACKKERAGKMHLENKPPVMGECVVCSKKYKKNNMHKTCSPECRKEHKAKY